VTTLRNRNPNRNHLFGWSAEASSVENISGWRAQTARHLEIPLFYPVESPKRASALASIPQQKIILATDLAEHSRLGVDSRIKSGPTANPPRRSDAIVGN
jgi:hypothetical protein